MNIMIWSKMNILSLFIISLLQLHCTLTTELYYRIVKNKNDTAFLINDRYHFFRIIPDIDTIAEFGIEYSTLTIMPEISEFIPELLLGSITYKYISNPIPSFKYDNPKNGFTRSPDERMRNCIQKIIAIEPSDFWVGSYLLSDKMVVNPAMVRWKKYGIITTWRNDLWNRESIRVGWITQDNKHNMSKSFGYIDFDKNYRGIGGNSDFKDPSTRSPQYDCRLIVINNSVIVTYAIEQQHAQYAIGYFKIDMNEESNKAFISESGHLLNKMSNGSLVMDYGMASQKNWIPFMFKDGMNERLLYIQNINPLHIVEYDPIERVLSTVSKISKIQLPWKGEYGLPIRGGTPAILVNGVYLSIFHTVSMFQMPYKIKTYFMGAITFCPTPPFNIHSISEFPIVKEFFYQGEWVKNNLDYVVFPIGIIKDNLGKYLYISMGTQDKSGYVVKFDIKELFRSLNIVSNCTIS